MTQVKQRKGWRMSCDVGKATEWLENECDVGEVTQGWKMSYAVNSFNFEHKFGRKLHIY